MLDKYVYKNLNKYGNCVITMDDIKKYGKKKIINDLLKHGFKCSIRIEGKDRDIDDKYIGKYNEANVIVEVIND